MSGGSFKYLCFAEPWSNHQEELERMRIWLFDHHYLDASVETSACQWQPSQDLRDIWLAVEWYESGDWSLEKVDKEIKKWRSKLNF